MKSPLLLVLHVHHQYSLMFKYLFVSLFMRYFLVGQSYCYVKHCSAYLVCKLFLLMYSNILAVANYIQLPLVSRSNK